MTMKVPASKASRGLSTLAAMFVVAAGLSACGGGDSSPPAPPPPPSADVTSSMTPASQDVSLTEGQNGSLQFTVTVIGSTGTAIPVVSIDNRLAISLDTIDTSVPGAYTVHLRSAPGTFAGTITFDLCDNNQCAHPVAGTHQVFKYSTSTTLADWTTYQRNPQHTGYVDAVFDPAAFHQVWTWSRPAGDGEPIGGINSVAAVGSQVIVTKDIYFGEGAVYALSTGDGTTRWTYSLGSQHSEGPPTIAHGHVYVPAQDESEQSALWAIDLATGAYRFSSQFGGQWQNFYAPVASSDSILQAAAGSLYSFSATDGTSRWSAGVGSMDQQAAAVDATHAYAYGWTATGVGLSVVDLATGRVTSTIADPFSTSLSDYSMFSAPVVGASGDVLNYSGGGFSGRAASSSEEYGQRPLVSYDTVNGRVGWRSAQSYLTQPALGNGVVYIARNNSSALDALDEADGHLLWSWTFPAGGPDTSFHRNTVVTRNLVFVSTDANVYAIDLNTHQAVWSYPKAGMLAITADSTLIIVNGSSSSDGGIVAISLR